MTVGFPRMLIVRVFPNSFLESEAGCLTQISLIWILVNAFEGLKVSKTELPFTEDMSKKASVLKCLQFLSRWSEYFALLQRINSTSLKCSYPLWVPILYPSYQLVGRFSTEGKVHLILTYLILLLYLFLQICNFFCSWVQLQLLEEYLNILLYHLTIPADFHKLPSLSYLCISPVVLT